MTPILLATVEEPLHISGRGCTILLEIGSDSPASVLHVGARIRLLKPTRGATVTTIHHVEMVTTKASEKVFALVSFPEPIARDDFPPGTQVFYLGPR